MPAPALKLPEAPGGADFRGAASAVENIFRALRLRGGEK